MFLSRPDILRCLDNQDLRFDPPIPRDRVAQVSIDLAIGRRFTTFKRDEESEHIASIRMSPSLWTSADLWEHTTRESFVLEPGEFVLAQTLEEVHIPDFLIGLVEGRSSFARIGLTVHATAPKIDPGFNGHITLEMTNFGKFALQLRTGIDKPAQLLLAEVTTPLSDDEVYGTGPEDRFQGQQSTIPEQG